MIKITPDCTTLASGSWDETVKIWDLPTGYLIHTLQPHRVGAFSIKITRDSKKTVIRSCKDLKLWNLKTGKLESHKDLIYDCTLHQMCYDNKKIIYNELDRVTNTQYVKVWDTLTDNVSKFVISDGYKPYFFSITPDESKIISACDDIVKIANGCDYDESQAERYVTLV